MSEIITLSGYMPKNLMDREKHFVRLDRLNDESVIVDAGACQGHIIRSLRRYRQTKKCRIFAIECDKKNLEVIKKQNFHNLQICEKALIGQNTEGPIKFFRCHKGPNWGSIEPVGLTERWRKAEDSYYVEGLKINDIFDEFGIDRIDYLKMDIEGSEKMVFDTMSMETAERIKQLSVEIHWPNRQVGITMAWTKNRFTELGFEVKHAGRIEIYCERE